jgi:antitoxin MazE
MGSLSIFKSPTDMKGNVYSIIIIVPFEVLNASFMAIVENQVSGQMVYLHCNYRTGGSMLRKIFRTGNSIVVSIPKDILDELKLSEGEDVSVELDSKQRQIVISPVEKPLAVGVDEAFARQVDEFIKEYRPALEALAK